MTCFHCLIVLAKKRSDRIRYLNIGDIIYTMVAKSDVQLKIKSYSVCEELFISFSTGMEINHS